MQLIVGKRPQTTDVSSIAEWARAYEHLEIDLGAGDGAFVRHQATRKPSTALLGLDTCGMNALENARRSPENARFVVLDALALPAELAKLTDCITINFPWGSLLRSLLEGDKRLLTNLARCPFNIRVNAGALAEQAYDFDSGIEAIRQNLQHLSPEKLTVEYLDRTALRAIPTTWSKRLAFGRDPWAVEFRSGQK
jgi:16S rRNA (adenine(1408)-N(1))-methyltransferase